MHYYKIILTTFHSLLRFSPSVSPSSKSFLRIASLILRSPSGLVQRVLLRDCSSDNGHVCDLYKAANCKGGENVYEELVRGTSLLHDLLEKIGTEEYGAPAGWGGWRGTIVGLE